MPLGSTQKRLVVLSLVLTQLLSAGALWAATKVGTLIGMEAKTKENQIVLYMSQPTKTQVSTPFSPQTNEKTLLIDLEGAQVPQISNRQDLLNGLKNSLPDVSSITMSEFNSSKPMVRLAVKFKSPESSATVLQAEGNQVVIQLQGPSTPSMQQANSRPPASYIGARPTQTLPTLTNAGKPVVDYPNTAPNEYTSPRPSQVTAAKIPVETADGRYLPSDLPEPMPSKLKIGDRDASVPSESPRRVKVPYGVRDRSENLITTTPNTTYSEFANSNFGYQHSYPERTTSDISENFGARLRTTDIDRTRITPPTTTQAVSSKIATDNTLENSPNTTNSVSSRINQLEDDMARLQQENRTLRQQLSSQKSSSLELSANPTARLAAATQGLPSQSEMGKLMDAEKAYQQGLSYLNQNNPTQAEVALKRAVTYAPKVPEYALALARVYAMRQDAISANQVLRSALQYNPNNSDLLNELGKVAFSNGRAEDAASYFKQALPANVMSNYASSLAKLQKLDDAERAYLVAIASQPNDPDLYYNLANLYLNAKQYSSAIQNYQTALKFEPNLPEAYYQMGIAYAEQGNRSQAVNSLQTYLKLSPAATNRRQVQDFINALQ